MYTNGREREMRGEEEIFTTEAQRHRETADTEMGA